MAMRKHLSILLLVFLSLSLTQSSCISKLWKKPKEPKEKVLDVFGNVESIDPEKIVVRTRGGVSETFILGPASIKGGDYDPGDFVHIYYKLRDEGKVITMVVEKIK